MNLNIIYRERLNFENNCSTRLKYFRFYQFLIPRFENLEIH